MIIHGRNLIIYANGTPIAKAKTCNCTLDVELLEVASPTYSDERCYIVSRLSWRMSAGTLLGSEKSMLMMIGTDVTLSFGTPDSPSLRASGNAICTTCKIDGQRGNLATASVEFLGTGTISRTLGDLFWGTANSEYVATKTGQKIRIIGER